MSTVTAENDATDIGADSVTPQVDVIVVGAGFSGLYLLHRLRAMGMTARCFEAADGVGGTWYWNRYPGARCDVESIDYSYSFDAELDEEWRWNERYATQPEILGYLEHVTDRFDLRRDIRFSTRIDGAVWDDANSLWRVRTTPTDESGERAEITCRHYIMATGCLSQPKAPEIAGTDDFAGDVYYTSRWPHDGVDFTGKRVGVIGTGSSAIQSIPIIAKQASALTVFQRTPNFSLPAHNGEHPADKLALVEGRRAEYREENKWTSAGVPGDRGEIGALMVSEEERNAVYEEAWQTGGLFSTLYTFNDLGVSAEANETIAEFIRNKIRGIVNDPETAETLCPTNHPFGTKRPCLDDGYYEVFNEPHVRLVDLLKDPIEHLTESGIKTAGEQHDFDVVVFATGFDAMTGALVAVDITGRDGVTLADAWADGPTTYLGLTTVGFPNFYAITGPGSPSVLSNMAVSIEQHVDLVCDTLEHLRGNNYLTIEPTATAQDGWVQHVNDFADMTLFPLANSWYMGANVPGKPRVVLPYVGGVGNYRRTCDEVVERDYLGFAFAGADGSAVCNDGVVRRVQPDVTLMLEAMAEMNLPPIETLPVEGAREFMEMSASVRPPGPAVGEMVDGTLPGADGELAYRLYRPDTPGPHPVVAYFHGGGWVLGHATSDEPFCRDLCDRSGAIIISIDYRHGPEARFPAAADDAIAATQWVADNAAALGGVPGRLAVAGWSAGANLAAVVCQHARDNGGPDISGQALLTPATDGSTRRPSMTDNSEGYVLTAALMDWFWSHYADEADRSDPKASPLLAENLADLPPAFIATCEFDPLRDEGIAYAEALAAAGNDVDAFTARGQIHTSITAVDMLLSGIYVRERMAAALQAFLAK